MPSRLSLTGGEVLVALRWTSALSLGVAEIDSQHEELFRRFERLEDAILAHDRSEAERLLDFLSEHLRAHCAAEEALMQVVGYPGLEVHAAEHRAFAAEIARLDLAQERHGTTAELVLRLDQDLGGWLHDHIYGSDMELARFVKSRGWDGGRPIAPEDVEAHTNG